MLQQVRIINGQKVLVPLSGSTPTNEVASGNMHPVTSNAVYDSLLKVEEVTITTVNSSCSWYICKCYKNRTIASGFPIPLELNNKSHSCYIVIGGYMGNTIGNVRIDKGGNLKLLNATFSGGNFYFGGTYICE